LYRRAGSVLAEDAGCTQEVAMYWLIDRIYMYRKAGSVLTEDTGCTEELAVYWLKIQVVQKSWQCID
jgi:hypothetical protein